MDRAGARDGDSQQLELFQAAELLLEECRTVLPGIQGLFGFQLVAVFSSHFHDALSQGEKHMHLLAIALIGVAIAFIMTPAATHRQGDPCEVTRRFIRLSTKLLLASMIPLTLGMSIDFYLVARVTTNSAVASVFAAVLFGVFVGLWFVAPRLWNRERRYSPASASGASRISRATVKRGSTRR
jgi:hypothetical protein